MKNTLMCCAALVAALSLLLCACTAPDGPDAATTAADLSAFVTAFDLSDLSQFLTEPQFTAVEAAVRENLASRGFAPEDFALQFDDPAEGSVKIPFDNAGGLDLARLDISKLADYIARQMESVLGAPRATTAASAATTTATTAKPAAATQAPTTLKTNPPTQAPTSQRTGTITNKQEMYPQELLLNNNQIVNINDRNRISGTKFWQYADSGFNLAFLANGKTYIFRRAGDLNERDYCENQFKNGKTETVALYRITGQKDGKVATQLVDTYNYTIGGATAGYEVHIVPNSNDTKRYSDYPNNLFYKTIEIRVGGNTGMPFTYWVDNEIYIVPDKQTIFLN